MAVKGEEDNLRLIILENFSEQGEKIHKLIQKSRKTSKEYLVPNKLVRFANGEGKAELSASVRGKDVYILSDIGNHSSKYDFFDTKTRMTPDEHFQDIKRIISSLHGNAARITVIMPLLIYSRQHARRGRESLDCAVALQELEKLGVDNIATFDAHDANVQNAIPLMAFDNFMPTNTILSQFIKDKEIDFSNLLVISPDEGAMGRSRYYSAMLGSDIGMFYKLRDYSVIENGKNPLKEHKYLGSDVKGKDLLIVDDMISSGGSIIDILDQLKNKKVKSITVIATFAFFTEGYKKFDDAYKRGLLKKVYSTNLSYIPSELRSKPWFSYVDCSSYLAEIIDTYNRHLPVSPLLNGRKEMFEKIARTRNRKKKPFPKKD